MPGSETWGLRGAMLTHTGKTCGCAANRKIAAQLNSGISTIAKETMHLYRKLSLADRDAAIALVRSAGGANAQTAGGSVSPEAAR